MKHLLSGYLCCLKNTSICVISSSGYGPLMLGEMGMPAAAASSSSAASSIAAVAQQVRKCTACSSWLPFCLLVHCCSALQLDWCTAAAAVYQCASPSASATKQPKMATAGRRGQCSSVAAAGDMILDSTGASRGSSGWLPSSCACKTTSRFMVQVLTS